MEPSSSPSSVRPATQGQIIPQDDGRESERFTLAEYSVDDDKPFGTLCSPFLRPPTSGGSVHSDVVSNSEHKLDDVSHRLAECSAPSTVSGVLGIARRTVFNDPTTLKLLFRGLFWITS